MKAEVLKEFLNVASDSDRSNRGCGTMSMTLCTAAYSHYFHSPEQFYSQFGVIYLNQLTCFSTSINLRAIVYAENATKVDVCYVCHIRKRGV